MLVDGLESGDEPAPTKKTTRDVAPWLAWIVDAFARRFQKPMRKRLTIVLLCGAMMVAPSLVTPARASHDWLAIGTAFRVGAAYISFVFGPAGYGYSPSYYYRYDRPIRYGGHRCSRYCFHDAGY